MLIPALSFLMGDLFLQLFSSLPSKKVIYFSFLMFMGTLFLLKKYKYSYCLTAACAGFLCSVWYANSILSWTLPHEWEGKPLTVIGCVNSLPVHSTWGKKFELKTTQIKWENKVFNTHTLIKLTSMQDLILNPGDEWQLTVRLKRIHGMQNPGGFDFEAWALQKGLRASGYVIKNSENKLLSHPDFYYFFSRMRKHLQEKMQAQFSNGKNLPWLTALTIGERSEASQADWQILRNTGTNHLMVAGGLHIGILAGFIYAIVFFLWKRVPFLIFFIPAQQIAAYAALLTGILYGLTCGFLIPTQRACLMLALSISAILFKRKVNPWNLWSLAMLVVLIANPLVVLTESFWLSFITIALIFYGMGNRVRMKGAWWKWGRVQWIIGLGLVPLTLFFFQEASLLSFVANSIAIPWMAIGILPFCLLGSWGLFFSDTIGQIFLYLAYESLNGLWIFLSWLAQFHFAFFQFAFPSFFMFIPCFAGFIILLFPQGLPGRWLGFVWIAPIFLYKPVQPLEHDIWFTLLDVGQGLAAVVQTKNHTLIYDTGPKFDVMDMGEQVVVPYLHQRMIKKIDRLVVSHGDNDHIGGAQAIIKSFPVQSIKTSAPEMFSVQHADYCLAGERWQWDGVTFTFLYPPEKFLLKPRENKVKNNYSCVLLIDNGEKKILLPGDIEKKTELDLLESPEKLRADIMVVPHHGSKTSGLPSFIEAVNPNIILYAAGYRNRYHFPHPGVAALYEKRMTRAFNTAYSGAVEIKIKKGQAIPVIEQYRIQHKKYWFDT